MGVRVVRDVDIFVEEEESFRIDRPTWRQGVKLDGCNRVGLE